MQGAYCWDSQKEQEEQDSRGLCPLCGGRSCKAGCEGQILLPLCLEVFHSPSWGGAAPAWSKPAFRAQHSV